jgi:hypothetical protein
MPDMSLQLAQLDQIVANVNGQHVRMCSKCGVQPATSKHGPARCAGCMASRRSKVESERDRRRAGTVTRGYGQPHRNLRSRWLPKVEAGNVFCARCGEWIDPSEPWDLGHDDLDRSQYRGPEHRACNRRTMTHAAERRSEPVEVRRNSRQW